MCCLSVCAMRVIQAPQNPLLIRLLLLPPQHHLPPVLPEFPHVADWHSETPCDRESRGKRNRLYKNTITGLQPAKLFEVHLALNQTTRIHQAGLISPHGHEQVGCQSFEYIEVVVGSRQASDSSKRTNSEPTHAPGASLPCPCPNGAERTNRPRGLCPSASSGGCSPRPAAGAWPAQGLPLTPLRTVGAQKMFLRSSSSGAALIFLFGQLGRSVLTFGKQAQQKHNTDIMSICRVSVYSETVTKTSEYTVLDRGFRARHYSQAGPARVRCDRASGVSREASAFRNATPCRGA